MNPVTCKFCKEATCNCLDCRKGKGDFDSICSQCFGRLLHEHGKFKEPPAVVFTHGQGEKIRKQRELNRGNGPLSNG